MKWEPAATKNKKRKNQDGMLPNIFKAIGIILLAIAVLFTIIIRTTEPDFFRLHATSTKIFTVNGFILGLLLIVWSRDKVEDELTQTIRLRAMAYALVFGTLLVIIRPLIDVLFRDPVSDMPGQQLIMTMLTVYLATYYVQKAKR